MQSAMQSAQARHDARLPPDVSDEDPAELEWAESNAERLMDGNDVEWGYRKADKGRATADEFASAVQMYLVDRQKDGEDQKDAFARLVIANATWGSRFDGRENALYLLGSRANLKNIAIDLLRPHAKRAVALDRQWQQESEECGF